MKKLRRQLSWAFTLASLLLVAIVAVSFLLLFRFRSDSGWLAHTGLVLASLARLNDSFAQSDILGRFIAMDGESSEEEMQALRAEALANLEAVKVITRDNARQQENLRVIEQKVRTRYNFLDRMITIRRTQGLDAAMDYWRQTRGLRLLSDAQHAISVAEEEEARLLQERMVVAGHAGNALILIVAVLNCALFILLLETFIFMRRWILGKIVILEQLEEANRVLGQRAISPDDYDRLRGVMNRVETYLHNGAQEGVT
ncbi:MAG TPA: CHASE3 domain-containing protein [Pyrinomonadaceae bacterium]